MAYEAPKLTEVGSVRDLTLGQGLDGNDDQFLFFTWGENPDPRS
ncbi:lasso RiPP family leader peptide-containing protein [Mumia sp. DW29H23]